MASLEDILDKATNPNNIGDNNSYAVEFATQVNKEFDGPTRAIKFISQKLGLHQEPVSLQTLNVIETCVKNCGQRFHQEIGKYRFLNELIKLLSPKYDGDITSQAVKDRVIELMYAWYRGLPHENKIAEAYRMLKQQGVIKRDPITSEAMSHSPRPTNTAMDDEEKSKLLSSLLKSTNPEDLQAANKLIKTMVKQEEERLEKFSKRVQELENVSNNVNLLNEMISAYSFSMTESDQSLMRDLYEDCLKMRTQLFRMASQSAEEKDDTLSEILSLSDDLTKTVDEYKRVVIQGEAPASPVSSNAKQNAVAPLSDVGPVHQSADSLLDLSPDFNPGPTRSENSQSEEAAASSLLDEQFKMLGLEGGVTALGQSQKPPMQEMPDDDWGAFGSVSQQLLQSAPQQQLLQSAPQQQLLQSAPQQQPQQLQGLRYPGQLNQNNQLNLPLGAVGQMRPQRFMGHGSFAMPGQVYPARPATSVDSATTVTGMAYAKAPPATKSTQNTTRSNDPLGFDVFADFKKESAAKSTSIGTAQQQDSNSSSEVGTLLDISNDETGTANNDTMSANSQTQAMPTSAGYVVPIDAIEPTSHSPITTFDKDGVKTILNIVKDKREISNPNVIVIVFSTISTNLSPVSDFRIEVSVPKSMKIKLQPPSASALPSFNPLLPPSAITQIILIANPLKETIRMQIRISYRAANSDVSETITIESLPVT